MTPRSQRGASLVVSLVSVAVVTAAAVALIRFASLEVSAAAAGRRHAQRTACIEACSGLVMSRYHALSGGTAALGSLSVQVDSLSGLTARTGDLDATQVQIKAVQPLPPTTFGATALGDITNTVRAPPRQPYRVLCSCVDADGRAVEAEFGVALGI